MAMVVGTAPDSPPGASAKARGREVLERKFFSADIEILEATPIVLSSMERSVPAQGRPVLTHSDDGVSYSNLVDADMVGVSGITNGIIKSLTSAHTMATPYRYGYIGGKRYLKLLADFSGTHGPGTPRSAPGS